MSLEEQWECGWEKELVQEIGHKEFEYMTVDFHIGPGRGEIQEELTPWRHKIKSSNPRVKVYYYYYFEDQGRFPTNEPLPCL